MVKYKKPNNYILAVSILLILAMSVAARNFLLKIQNKVNADEGFISRVEKVYEGITGLTVEYGSIFQGVAVILLVIVIAGIYWAMKKNFYQGIGIIFLFNTLGLLLMWQLLNV